MNVKTGKCLDCPQDAQEQPLIAKRCQRHYWEHRAKINAKKPKAKAKFERAKTLGVFFANQTLTMPLNCEECNALLPKSPDWLRRACIAHILPKREIYGFPSVAIHPQNKIFLCPDCHTNMDNLGVDRILKMKTLPIMQERVKKLIECLKPAELNKLPEHFKQK